jgi:hypothetical protein
VHLVAGPRIGRTCPPPLSSCLGVAGATYVGAAVANDAGIAVLTTPLPPTVPAGAPVALQALTLGPGGALSQVWSGTVDAFDAARDDGDALAASAELAFGSDPYVFDSDGGGVGDLRESLLGLDPNDPADDDTVEDCFDGRDNDGDGDRDCADADCVCEEVACADGTDDDLDGLVDCEDADCLGDAACEESDCADGLDDDGDGAVDCEDDDCWSIACHDSVVSHVVRSSSVRVFRRSLERLSAQFEGRVYVDGPGGPRVCDWVHEYRSSMYGVSTPPVFAVTPGCGVGSSVVPSRDDLELVGDTLMSTRFGVPWAVGTAFVEGVTTLIGGTYTIYGTTANRYTYFLPNDEWSSNEVVPGSPLGFCDHGGAPVRRYLDLDGDGYGVAEPEDRWGQPGGTAWTCGPTPGTTDLPGDCDDLDPTWSPAVVSLAPGASCLDVGWFDRDGDGIDDALDTTPDDGSTP